MLHWTVNAVALTTEEGVSAIYRFMDYKANTAATMGYNRQH